MKLLFDFLPIILFFGTYKYAGGRTEWASTFASDHFGFLVAGGVVGPKEAPVLLATLVVMAATLAQVVYLLAMRRKIDTMLWVSLALVVVLGGATVYFHSETFIKWKPTVLYWAMASALALSAWVLKKNLIQKLMGAQLSLPASVWERLNLAWAGFFAGMGALNLYIAYAFDTDAWVNFKLFGGLGLMVVFTLAQGLYVSRHVIETGPAAVPPAKP
ncbi:MAG: septation protein A [Pseudomonadota bacterium]